MSSQRDPASPGDTPAEGPPLRAVVVTVSDSRTLSSDTGGLRASELLQRAGHQVIERVIVPPLADKIRFVLSHWLDREDVDLLIVGGGTGVRPGGGLHASAPSSAPAVSDSDSDSPAAPAAAAGSSGGTIDVLRDLLDHHIEGFGELFRWLSFQEIGAAAMRSRALAGFARGKAVFAMPGSPRAISLAMERLILPEIVHLLAELRSVD